MTKTTLGEIFEGLENNSAGPALRAINDSPLRRAAESLRSVSGFKPAESLQRMSTPKLISAQIAAMIGDRQQSMARIGSFGMMAGRAGQNPSILAAGGLSDVLRTNQWATRLANAPSSTLKSLYPGLATVTDLDTIQKAVRLISGTPGGFLTMRTALRLVADSDSSTGLTCLKLSAFVGARNVFGFDSAATSAAYRGLFGKWRTRSDLPDHFWREPSVRQHMYEEAGVDSGLVEATIDATLEVAIESGLTGGLIGDFSTNSTTVATVSLGSSVMLVRSSNARVDAYQLLGTFEEKLREFLARKLRDRAGSTWFKHRVNGDIYDRAKKRKADALRDGESPTDLIAYTDLGDLRKVIRTKNNWEEVFEAVFINAQRFEHDMQTLIAGRRPAAHYREIDGVQLLEMFCVINRLIKQMDNDGSWKDAIKPDE